MNWLDEGAADDLFIFLLLLTLGRLPGPDSMCLRHVEPGGGILEHVCGGGTV